MFQNFISLMIWSRDHILWYYKDSVPQNGKMELLKRIFFIRKYLYQFACIVDKMDCIRYTIKWISVTFTIYICPVFYQGSQGCTVLSLLKDNYYLIFPDLFLVVSSFNAELNTYVYVSITTYITWFSDITLSFSSWGWYIVITFEMNKSLLSLNIPT